MGQIIFEDDFNDNSNKWWTGKDENVCCEIINGNYLIERYKETGDYAVWQKLPIMESKAFSLEASFTFLGGYTKNGFGFLWGQKSINNVTEKYSGYHYFLISSIGKFVIRSYNPQTKNAEPVKDWTDSQFIKVGENQSNVLKIVKFDNNIDNQLYFLINDNIVFQTNNLTLLGYETGFIVCQNMKVAINSFLAKYYANLLG